MNGNTTYTIAVLGLGNVGLALAIGWQKAGHTILPVARNADSGKTQTALAALGLDRTYTLSEAKEKADVILIAIPADAMTSVAEELAGYTGIVIDATNSVKPRADGFPTAWHYLDATLHLPKLIKCFNSTGAENMANPVYHGSGTTMLLAGHNDEAKLVVQSLALDLGFGECLDLGGADQVVLLEAFAKVWINLAIMKGQGRNIGWQLQRR